MLLKSMCSASPLEAPFFTLWERTNSQLEMNLTYEEILGIQYKGNYASVFAQGQGSLIGVALEHVQLQRAKGPAIA